MKVDRFFRPFNASSPDELCHKMLSPPQLGRPNPDTDVLATARRKEKCPLPSLCGYPRCRTKIITFWMRNAAQPCPTRMGGDASIPSLCHVLRCVACRRLGRCYGIILRYTISSAKPTPNHEIRVFDPSRFLLSALIFPQPKGGLNILLIRDYELCGFLLRGLAERIGSSAPHFVLAA